MRGEGRRSVMRLRTKLEIQNFPILDTLLKIKTGCDHGYPVPNV